MEIHVRFDLKQMFYCLWNDSGLDMVSSDNKLKQIFPWGLSAASSEFTFFLIFSPISQF